jgi:hypothetical protein
MARQIVKGLTMLMLVVGMALVSAGAAYGQRGRLIAQVPFNFVVDGKTMAAGKYDVTPINDGGSVLAIRSSDAKSQLISQTNTGEQAKPNAELNARLVFHRYGDTYFLSQIWMAGEETSRQLRRTSQERELQRELGAIAQDRTKPVYEVVEVIATGR